MKYLPYVFGYFSKRCTWEEASAREEWVRELLDVVRKHTPTQTFVQNCSLSDGSVQRFVTTQLQPPKKIAALHRFQSRIAHDHLPYESLDWKTPLGICRFLEEVAAGPSGKIAELFVRFVPRNDYITQRAAELHLGKDNFEKLILKRKFHDALRLLRTPTKGEFEQTKRLVGSVPMTEWTYPDSLEHFERELFRNRKRSTIELLTEIRELSNELRTFLETHTLDETKVRSRLLRMDKIIHIGSNPDNIVELAPNEFEQVLRADLSRMDSSPNINTDELVRECERLAKLLEQHRIDYVQVPNHSLQQLQTFVAQQTAAQQACVKILFDESSSNADKFRAENDIDKIQKKLETAKRKQFDFPEFAHEQVQKLDSLRPQSERVRAELNELLKDIHPLTPFSKLPFRVRRNVDPFAQPSNTHLQCWLAVLRQDHSIDYLKYTDIRKSMEQVFETRKRTQGLLLTFHFGHERCMEMFSASFRSFLLSLET